MSDSDWKQHRAEVFETQRRALAAAAEAEHAKATAMIAEAIAAFRAAGIAPHPLKAHPYRGSRPVATTHVGWYLKSDRTVGIDTDGKYYMLSASGDVLTRLRKATLTPSLAPLVVGRGGRDGEAIDLVELLQMRLDDPVPPATRGQGAPHVG